MQDVFSFLRDLHQGKVLEELSEEITAITAAVRAAGKSGELTLKVKFKTPPKGDVSYLTFEAEVSSKKPRRDRGDTIFFITNDNRLTRQDPTQTELPFRGVVDASTGEIIRTGSAN